MGRFSTVSPSALILKLARPPAAIVTVPLLHVPSIHIHLGVWPFTFEDG